MKLVVAILLLATVALRADDFGDVIPDDATRASFDLAKWCEVDGLRFTFEKTPLSEISRALGGGKMERTGTAGAATFDYYVDFTDGKRLIRFSSGNDMGGDEHALMGVTIMALASGDRALPRLKGDIRFPFGWSNISLSALRNKFGLTKSHGGVSAYLYTSFRKGTDSVGNKVDYETQASLMIRVRDGKIIELNVDRVTSS